MPVLFPELIEHVDIRNKINWPVLSAGFCRFNFNHNLDINKPVDVWGESVSLKVRHKMGDSEIIKKMHDFHI